MKMKMYKSTSECITNDMSMYIYILYVYVSMYILYM